MVLKRVVSRIIRQSIKSLYPDSTLTITHKTWNYQRNYFLNALEIDLAIDVGANIGQWASDFRRCRPDSYILSFEPDLRCKIELETAASLDDKWSLNFIALGSSDSVSEMNLWDMEGGSSSLVPLNEFGEGFTGWKNADMNIIKVPVRKLESIMEEGQLKKSSSVLKIDVQGYEMEVLTGAEKILRDFKVIEIELPLIELYSGSLSSGSIILYLEAKGFALVALATERWAFPGAADCDALFVRKDLYISMKG